MQNASVAVFYDTEYFWYHADKLSNFSTRLNSFTNPYEFPKTNKWKFVAWIRSNVIGFIHYILNHFPNQA